MSRRKAPEKGKKRRRRQSPIIKFLKLVLVIVSVFLLTAWVAIFAYDKVKGNNKGEQNQGILDSIISKDVNVNAAIFGVDGDGTRTDVILVANFNSKTDKVSIMSIPRDTRVTITPEIQENIKASGRRLPHDGITKINGVHSYSSKENGCINATKQLEDLLGIKIDYYAKIDLNGFKEVVDLIGGVDIDVPQDMKYSDPEQDLYINLKAGPQHLDSDHAEQLVRFREYKDGDVGRVEVQHLFLEAFAKKVLSTETIMGNLSGLVSAAFEYVETNVTLGDALKYVKYVKDIKTENIVTETLPGVGQYVGKVSYFIYDEVETKLAVDRVFRGYDPEADDGTDSKHKRIEVSNGGETQGLAGNISKWMTEKGYTISSVTTYNGEKTDNTRIIVSKDGMAQDVQKLFPGSKVVVDTTLLNAETDIKIILGVSETNKE